jgi:hypothetical protein
MKRERPILYSTLMIQAKLEGRKTQTRRIIKESFNGCLTNGGPHPCPNDPVVIYPGEVYESFCHPGESITVDYPEVRALFHCSTLDAEAKCPYGKPGDILWARESHALVYDRADQFSHYAYKADGDPLHEGLKWRPSIHMPKDAARIYDEIVSIRVERLQDISEQDAIAEGIDVFLQCRNDDNLCFFHPNKDIPLPGIDNGCIPVDVYRSLWESINGPGSWDLNPWVWVIETKTLSTTGRGMF